MPTRPVKTLAAARKRAAWENIPESIYTLGMERGDTESLLPMFIEDARGPAQLPDDEVLEMFGLEPGTMSPDVQRSLLGLGPMERERPKFGETPMTAFLQEAGSQTFETFVPETPAEVAAMAILGGVQFPGKKTGTKKVTQLVKKAVQLADKYDITGAKKLIGAAKAIVTEMTRVGTKGVRAAERVLSKGERSVERAAAKAVAAPAAEAVIPTATSERPIRAAIEAAEKLAAAPKAAATISGKEALRLAKREGKQAIKAARGGATDAAEGFLKRAEAAARAGTGAEGKAAVEYVGRLQDKLIGVMERKGAAAVAAEGAAVAGEAAITKAGVEAGRRAIGKKVASGAWKIGAPVIGWTLAGLAWEPGKRLVRKGMRAFGPSEEEVASAQQRETEIARAKVGAERAERSTTYLRALSGAATAEEAYFRIHDPNDLQARIQQTLLQAGMTEASKDEAYSRIMQTVPMAQPGRILKALTSTSPSVLSLIDPQTPGFEEDAQLRMKALDELLSGGGG